MRDEGNAQNLVNGYPHTSRRTIAARIIMAKGILSLLLGPCHETAIPWIWDHIRPLAPWPVAIEYVFWFGAGGALFIFLGVLDVWCSSVMKKGHDLLAWRMSLFGALLYVVGGLLGWAVLGAGPPCLVLALGLCGTAALWTIRSDERGSSCPR